MKCYTLAASTPLSLCLPWILAWIRLDELRCEEKRRGKETRMYKLRNDKRGWCPDWKLLMTIHVCVQQGAEEMAGDGEDEEYDLGQLPGHHPLIKDGMSDEGLSDQYLYFHL